MGSGKVVKFTWNDTCLFSIAGHPIWDNISLLCDTSTENKRPVVPASWRCHAFNLIHGLSHPSICTTLKLIASKFNWKGMHKQVRHWVKAYIPCQSPKIHSNIRLHFNKSASVVILTTFRWKLLDLYHHPKPFTSVTLPPPVP